MKRTGSSTLSILYFGCNMSTRKYEFYFFFYFDSSFLSLHIHQTYYQTKYSHHFDSNFCKKENLTGHFGKKSIYNCTIVFF